jgi:hypothetical protein
LVPVATPPNLDAKGPTNALDQPGQVATEFVIIGDLPFDKGSRIDRHSLSPGTLNIVLPVRPLDLGLSFIVKAVLLFPMPPPPLE